jgi:hypothetical protein
MDDMRMRERQSSHAPPLSLGAWAAVQRRKPLEQKTVADLWPGVVGLWLTKMEHNVITHFPWASQAELVILIGDRAWWWSHSGKVVNRHLPPLSTSCLFVRFISIDMLIERNMPERQ